MNLELDIKACDCGCGELYQPTREFQRFVNDVHRQNYHRNNVKAMKKVMEALGPDGVARVLSGTYE